MRNPLFQGQAVCSVLGIVPTYQYDSTTSVQKTPPLYIHDTSCTLTHGESNPCWHHPHKIVVPIAELGLLQSIRQYIQSPSAY